MDAAANNAAQAGGATPPAPGTAEYNEAMAAKGVGVPNSTFSADGTQVTNHNTPPADAPQDDQQDQTPDRPQWLPEKFKTPEEMAASYAELEKKLSGNQEQPPKADEQKADEKTPELPGKLNFADFSAEYEKNGGLSAESYAKLAEAGISQDMVNAYIAGQELQAQQYMDAGYNVAGGKEQFDQMVTWAKGNLSKAEIHAFNSQIATGDVETMKLAVAGLRSRFVAVNGQQPQMLFGNSGNQVVTGVFNSRAEVTAAMSDPRYQRDPAYRKSVEAMVARSNVF